MADVKQVSVELVDIPFRSIPGDRSFQLSYQESLNATTETADVANEANREAATANTRNNEQDKIISKQGEEIETTKKQLSVALGDISQNKVGIKDNKDAIESHVNSNSQHGVTGDNVGNEDYAQELIGGVVLLAANVSGLTNNAINIGTAPASYDQAYTQSQTDAINSLASKQNDIINKINELIQGQITAKQMGA